MVNEGDIKKFLRADYFLFQKIQNHTWETVRKSGSLEEVKKEFGTTSLLLGLEIAVDELVKDE